MRIEVDVSRLERLAHQLDGIDATAFGEAAVRVVNEVADDTYELARPRMIKTINLTDDYVKRRMRVEHATSANNVVASVVASGASADMTKLAAYDGRQITKPVNWSNERIAQAGHKFGKWPGWTRRTGSAVRGIAPNLKAAAATVEVVRGSVKPVTNGFFMPLRNNNGLGLFTREGPGQKNYKHRYGPSVYQLFRKTADLMLDEVGADLEKRIADEAEQILAKAIP